MDRADAVRQGLMRALEEEHYAKGEADLAMRELVEGHTEKSLGSMRRSLGRLWLVEELRRLGRTPFARDADVTNAWEKVGEDLERRDIWVKDRLDRFTREAGPLPDLSRIADATKRQASGSADTAHSTPSLLSLGQGEVPPANCHSVYVQATSQGWFRADRLLISVPGDVGEPCEQCGHHNNDKGPLLRDLQVESLCFGCFSFLANGDGRLLPAELFSAQRVEKSPIEPTYRVAGPGVRITLLVRNLGRHVIRFSAAMLGAYIKSASDFAFKEPQQ